MAPTASPPTSAAGCPVRGVLDGEGAADLLGASLQVGQPAAGDVVGNAFAVVDDFDVDDFDTQLVCDP